MEQNVLCTIQWREQKFTSAQRKVFFETYKLGKAPGDLGKKKSWLRLRGFSVLLPVTGSLLLLGKPNDPKIPCYRGPVVAAL